MATHTRDQLELANACHPSMPDAARRAGFFFKESGWGGVPKVPSWAPFFYA